MSADIDRVRVAAPVAIARATALLLLLASVYEVFVLAATGRWIDVDSFRILARPSGPLGVVANEFRQMMPFVLATLVFVLGAIGLFQRRWNDVVRSLVLIAATLGTAEVLKLVLPRPWMADSLGIVGNSYPSGHVAITLALTLVAVVLSPTDRWHIWLACATGAAVVGVAWSSVVSSAHRPSDVIGSALLVGFLVQVVFWRRPAMVDSRPRFATALVSVSALGLVLVVIAAIFLTVGAEPGALATGIPGLLLLCAAPSVYAVMLAPTGPLPGDGERTAPAFWLRRRNSAH